MNNKDNTLSPAARALRTFLIVLGVLVIYAYAVNITEINLESRSMNSARRQRPGPCANWHARTSLPLPKSAAVWISPYVCPALRK